MNDYTLWQTDDLVQLFKMNLGVMAGGLTALLGDAPMPDVRDLYVHIKHLSTDDVMQAVAYDYHKIQKNMDVTRMVVKVQGENLAIQEELMKRIHTDKP